MFALAPTLGNWLLESLVGWWVGGLVTTCLPDKLTSYLQTGAMHVERALSSPHSPSLDESHTIVPPPPPTSLSADLHIDRFLIAFKRSSSPSFPLRAGGAARCEVAPSLDGAAAEGVGTPTEQARALLCEAARQCTRRGGPH